MYTHEVCSQLCINIGALNGVYPDFQTCMTTLLCKCPEHWILHWFIANSVCVPVNYPVASAAACAGFLFNSCVCIYICTWACIYPVHHYDKYIWVLILQFLQWYNPMHAQYRKIHQHTTIIHYDWDVLWMWWVAKVAIWQEVWWYQWSANIPVV